MAVAVVVAVVEVSDCMLSGVLFVTTISSVFVCVFHMSHTLLLCFNARDVMWSQIDRRHTFVLVSQMPHGLIAASICRVYKNAVKYDMVAKFSNIVFLLLFYCIELESHMLCTCFRLEFLDSRSVMMSAQFQGTEQRSCFPLVF